MITTKELANWAVKAIDIHELSWVEDERSGKYLKSKRDAVVEARPENANDIEVDMVVGLLHTLWNDIQDWAKALNEFNG